MKSFLDIMADIDTKFDIESEEEIKSTGHYTLFAQTHNGKRFKSGHVDMLRDNGLTTWLSEVEFTTPKSINSVFLVNPENIIIACKSLAMPNPRYSLKLKMVINWGQYSTKQLKELAALTESIRILTHKPVPLLGNCLTLKDLERLKII